MAQPWRRDFARLPVASGRRTVSVLRLLGVCLGLYAGLCAGLVAPRTALADADTRANAMAGTTGRFDYATTTLANGLRVIVLEDDAAPLVEVRVWYHVGSKDESPERQGFAHMFEHMMFRGTDAVGPGEFDRLLQSVGGSNNAYTFFDQTVYHELLPASQLDLALYLEADRMASLKIDQLSFDTERAVVEEERRRGINQPYGTLFERQAASLFKVHPYRWTPIGKIPHLRQASIDELARFWETYYVPNNATLVIVGDVKKDEVLKKAGQYFGWIPRGVDVPKVTAVEPEQTAPREVRLVEPTGPLPVVEVYYRTVPVADKDATALQIALGILADGESSRLYSSLVKDRQWASDVSSSSLLLEQAGVSGVSVTVDPAKARPADVDTAVREAVAKLAAEAVPPEELDKVKLNQLKSQVLAAETAGERADLLGLYAVVYNDLDRVNRRFDEIRAVTADDIRRVAATYLTEPRRTTFFVEPVRRDTELLQDAQTPPSISAITGIEEDGPPAPKHTDNPVAVHQGPKAAAVRPDSFPKSPPTVPLGTSFPNPVHTDRTLANGLRVVSVARHDLPLVNFTLGVRSGAATDAPDSVGAASMAAQLISQGTTRADALAFNTELERYAVGLSARVTQDEATVSASCISALADPAMRLFAEAVITPAFPERDFAQLKDQTLAGLAVKTQNPKYVAERELARRLFGPHPYSRPAEGTPADVEKLDRRALVDWWTTHLRPDNCVLYVAGDLTPQQAFDLAEKYFGQWAPQSPTAAAAPAAPTPATAAIPPRSDTTIYLVDRPGLVQSEIRTGQVTFNRTDPRWGTARVLSRMFGESFTSRINEALRVRRGLTYGAFGYIRPQKDAGVFVVDTFTKTPTTADTVRAILDEIRTARTQPASDAEVNNARDFLLGSFVVRRERAQDLVDDLWLLDYAGLPADFFEALLKAQAATTAADVSALAAATFDETRLAIVVVADAARVKADLEKIARVIEVSADTPPASPAEAVPATRP